MPTPEHRLRGRRDQATDEAGEQVDEIGTRAPLDVELRPDDDGTVQRHHGAAHLHVVGQVDRDDLVGAGAHSHEDRGLADALAGADAELLDEPLGDERGDEVGDRDASELRGTRQVRPGGRPLVEQVLQHERPVVGTRVLGQHLGEGSEPGAQPSHGGHVARDVRRHVC